MALLTSEAMARETIINKDSKFLTLINTFTVDPVNQQRLIDLLTMATEVA
ncbi:MAG: hypothetical protein QM762_07830 [Chryseolinea sp.]